MAQTATEVTDMPLGNTSDLARAARTRGEISLYRLWRSA
jgi:hypothetical protein